MIVADATPLIHLGRAGALGLLPRLYQRVLVPRAVMEEILGGGQPRPESRAILDASETWLETRPLSPKEREDADSLLRGAPVGRGEAETLALAASLGMAALMDDRIAIDVARIRGTETRWTTSVVLEAYRAGALDRKGATETIENLVAAGLWIRQDVLLRILATLGPD